jgi:hypothetical protein
MRYAYSSKREAVTIPKTQAAVIGIRDRTPQNSPEFLIHLSERGPVSSAQYSGTRAMPAENASKGGFRRLDPRVTRVLGRQ